MVVRSRRFTSPCFSLPILLSVYKSTCSLISSTPPLSQQLPFIQLTLIVHCTLVGSFRLIIPLLFLLSRKSIGGALERANMCDRVRQVAMIFKVMHLCNEAPFYIASVHTGAPCNNLDSNNLLSYSFEPFILDFNLVRLAQAQVFQ